MSRPLYEITAELETLGKILDSFDEEFELEGASESLEQWLDELTSEQEHKIDAYAAVIRQAEWAAKACREESQRLAERARVEQAKMDRLKLSLMLHMDELQVRSLTTARNKFRIQNNGGKVPIIVMDEAQLPPECLTCPAPVPDKEAIRSLLDANLSVPGAKFGEVGRHLRIQ